MGRVPQLFAKPTVVVSIVVVLSTIAGSAWAQGESGEALPADPEEEAEPASPAAEPEAPSPRRSGANTHDGFFLRFGLNAGLLVLSADTSPDEVKFSGLQAGGDVMLGVTPAPGLVVGGALVAARANDPKVSIGDTSHDLGGSVVFYGLGAFGNYYLDPREGLHLQGMAGYGGLDFVSASGASGSSEPRGIFVGLGVGYDFWVGAEWSVGPFGRVLYGHMGAKDVTYRYLFPSVGVALTLH